jgi:hypothetical protein
MKEHDHTASHEPAAKPGPGEAAKDSRFKHQAHHADHADMAADFRNKRRPHRFDQASPCSGKYLVRNGIIVLKFFLNLSKDEQKRRLLARINTPEKNWKFSLRDAEERAHWDAYMNAFEETFNHTSTESAPWHIIPADNKWFTRTVIADVIVEKLQSLNLSYPGVSKQHRRHLLEAKQLLENEPDSPRQAKKTKDTQ